MPDPELNRLAGKVTMREIAQLAGVSESTVSRALAGSSRITEKTRTRVQAIAEARGYAINASASRLRLRAAGSIGLIVPLAREPTDQAVSDPFFLEMIGAITEATTERGLDLIVALPGAPGHVSRNRLLSSGKADGLIVIGQAGRHDRLNELAGQGAPLVAWGGRIPGQKYVTVGSDNVRGGRLATAHLIEQGRRRILFAGDQRIPEVALRHQGYGALHDEAGIEQRSDRSAAISFAGGETEALITAAVENGPAFDAVFAASDLIAIAAMRTLRRLGRRVPDDVAIVGYDDISLASYVYPALTTISQDLVGGGQRMTELILERLDGGEIISEFTETRLVVRDSTQAVSGAPLTRSG